jgi:hypothetical protein
MLKTELMVYGEFFHLHRLFKTLIFYVASFIFREKEKMNRNALLVFFILLSSTLFGNCFVVHVKAQTTPTVSVIFPNNTNSSLNEYRVGQTFRVNIVVNSPDIGIWSWQVGIYFNKDVLECTNLGEGNFLSGKYTLGFIAGTIHNDVGYVTISGDSLREPETTGVKGNGVLMWFDFRVKGYGSSLLNLTLSPPDLTCGTKLNQRVNNDVVPISPITLYDGTFNNGGLAPVGGSWSPVDKIALLTPYIGMSIALIALVLITVVYIKRVKHEKEKQQAVKH